MEKLVIYSVYLLLIFSSKKVNTQEMIAIRGEYLFISETEVTNHEYNAFLEDIKKTNNSFYKCYLPDTVKWRMVMGDAEDHINYYHRHPAYLDFPAVNISYESALAYCEWLTKRFNRIDTTRIIKVRLPTKEEWEFAAKGNLGGLYPWRGDLPWANKGENKGEMLANFKRGKGDYMGVAGNLNDGADITAKVRSYPPNDFGLYDMAGNVEEMIIEEGVTKGGSWRDRFDDLEILNEQFMNGPSPEVGFRWVLEVKKVKTNNAEIINFDNKFFKKQFAKINDTLFGGMYEISNKIFNQFLTEQSIKKDETSWLRLFKYANFYQENYAALPKFKSYPAVNLTKELANQFCNWLTFKYEGKKKIKFRLPTENEWLLIAQFNHSNFPWKGNNIKDKNGKYRANFCPKRNEGFFGEDIIYLNRVSNFSDLEDYDGYGVLAPTNSYEPNKKNCYNLAGNVAELLLDKNYTKGGSWGSTENDLHVNSYESYKLPSPFVGFRVVAIYFD